ncbi:hypothetical protein C5167_047975 [Papaver somniferum]|uniref:Bet v I/Major latex protein domain-containing protein n=1 Tax=Papaver somniferum TaxID=3469 RepID=A0A4Y7KKS6_PAPSO|nr:major latex protein 146-like [Papaver somniferum]RZC72495.1 hypothetical protein C5167_047975 [Papaver somniferum]
MAEIHKLEVEYKVKCSADKFYALMTRDIHKLPKYAPKTIHNIQVLPGHCEVGVGSIVVWDYVQRVQGDKPTAVMAKVKITAMDHTNLSLTNTVLEGDLRNCYTSFAINLAITPIQRDGNYKSLVKWSVQYQKANKDVPDPTYFMKVLEVFTKELEANLLKEE